MSEDDVTPERAIGRPRLSEDDRLAVIIPSFRVTHRAADKLDGLAQAQGVGRAEALRRLLDETPSPAPLAVLRCDAHLVTELNTLGSELRRIGVNVNHLARAVHTDRRFAAYWEDVGVALEAELVKIRTVLTRTLEGIE